MVIINIIDGKHHQNQNIGPEEILKEYKAFFLRKAYNIYDFHKLQNGILTNKLQIYTHNSIIYYFDKYFKKYICSLSNIDKRFLQKFIGENFSNFYIGVNDDGIITGIPVIKGYLPMLVSTIESKISEYYKDIIGLHNEKGINEIQIGNEKFYDFNRIKEIMKKHTKINIHILKKNNTTSENYDLLNSQVDDILQKEKIYQKEYREYKIKKNEKKKFNDIYSQSFHKLIRSKILIEFSEYIVDFDLNEFLELLRSKINKQGDVKKYLNNGIYIKHSLFPNDKQKDEVHEQRMTTFLETYKTFKLLKLKNNIRIEPFSKKAPKLKLNPLFKNTNCFTNLNDNVIYIMIQIELPFIKDNRVFIGLKDKKTIRIIKRTYEPNMNTPCTEVK